MLGSQYSVLDIEAFAARFYGQKPILITPYGYPVRFADLAAGAVTTQTLNIAANADFIMLGLSCRVLVDSADEEQVVSTLPVPLVRALITDSGTGENFTNGTVDLGNYVQQGYVKQLPYPRLLTGKTAVSVQLSSYSAEAYALIELYFDGVQVRAY
jgi:hypothetical protein